MRNETFQTIGYRVNFVITFTVHLSHSHGQLLLKCSSFSLPCARLRERNKTFAAFYPTRSCASRGLYDRGWCPFIYIYIYVYDQKQV